MSVKRSCQVNPPRCVSVSKQRPVPLQTRERTAGGITPLRCCAAGKPAEVSIGGIVESSLGFMPGEERRREILLRRLADTVFAEARSGVPQCKRRCLQAVPISLQPCHN